MAFCVGWTVAHECPTRNARTAARQLVALEGVEVRLLVVFRTFVAYSGESSVAGCVAAFWRLARQGTAFDENALLVATMGKLVVYSQDAYACYRALGVPWADPKGNWEAVSFAVRDHFYPEVHAGLAAEMSAMLLEEEAAEAAKHRTRMERRRQKRHRRKEKRVVERPVTDQADEAELEDEEKQAEQEEEDSALASCLVCPVTCERMRDPVVLNDGHTYERKAIVAWMERSTRSPLTGETLDPGALVPNHALRAILAATSGDV